MATKGTLLGARILSEIHRAEVALESAAKYARTGGMPKLTAHLQDLARGPRETREELEQVVAEKAGS